MYMLIVYTMLRYLHVLRPWAVQCACMGMCTYAHTLFSWLSLEMCYR